MKRVEPADKVCQQLPPEEVYKQFGRASKLLLHPKDVPDIKLLNFEKSINRKEIVEKTRNEDINCCEPIEETNPSMNGKKVINIIFGTNMRYAVNQEQSKSYDGDSKKSEESINWYRADMHIKGNEERTSVLEPTYLNNNSKKSLNCLEVTRNFVTFPREGEGGHLQQAMEINSLKVQSDKSEKLLICYVHTSATKQEAQDVKIEKYILTGDWMCEKVNSEKLINCTYQRQCKQFLDEALTTTPTLCNSQREDSEKSIHQLGDRECDREQMEQMVTPVNIPPVTCYQTVENNPEVEQTEEINSLGLQQHWGKAVSFITNTSNKLRLSSALCSLAQIPEVTKSGKVEENSVQSNDLDNANYISELNSSFTFFL